MIPFELKRTDGRDTETIWTDVLIMEEEVLFLLGANDQTRLDFNLKLGKRKLIFSYDNMTYEIDLVRNVGRSDHV